MDIKGKRYLAKGLPACVRCWALTSAGEGPGLRETQGPETRDANLYLLVGLESWPQA